MTTEAVESIESALSSAMSATRMEDVESGVKDLIQDELAVLSPDATVTRTNYFNHTYMPDFVLEWRDQGRTASRPVFLRNAIRPSVARDLENLESRDPVVLSLRQPAADDSGQLLDVRTRVTAAQHSLVTDAVSLSRFNGSRDGTTTVTRPPLLELVRANVMRGARGMLTGDEADQLSASASVDLELPSARTLLDSFIAGANDFFAEDAAVRLRRAADLLRVGTAGADQPTESLSATGRLSSSELRVLLPYLLSRPGLSGNRALWLQLGAMIDIDDLVGSRAFLDGLDLTPLVRPNLSSWTAKRAQLVINADAMDAEEEQPPSSGWKVVGNALCAQAGPWRLFIATDARYLKGREFDVGRAPEWQRIRAALDTFILESVSLRGLARRVEISAEESGDVRGDVELVIASLDDSFAIPYVAVRPTAVEWRIDVDFSGMTATASRGGADVLTLTRVGFELLGYQQSVDMQAVMDTEDEPFTGGDTT
jgi:hypothetical protein